MEIDIANENIITLFNNAHHLSIGPETQIYRDGGYKVSEMSEEDKMTLLARQWSPLVEQIGPSSSDGYTWTLYLNEDTLKDIYERTFGPNTYHQVNQITDGLCTTLTYDATDKRYSYVGKYGCGGTTVFSVHEKIISTTKYNDRIEIVSATVYLDGMSNQIYKDYNKTKPLGENVFYSNNYTDEEREALENKYIEDNKDNLEQYTCTYNLNEDGFYYLTSVERTKA